MRCAQDISIERRVRVERCTNPTSDLPEDIRGFGSTNEVYLNTGRNAATTSNSEILRYLQDPDSVWIALGVERDIRAYCDRGTPFVETGVDG